LGGLVFLSVIGRNGASETPGRCLVSQLGQISPFIGRRQRKFEDIRQLAGPAEIFLECQQDMRDERMKWKMKKEKGMGIFNKKKKIERKKI